MSPDPMPEEVEAAARAMYEHEVAEGTTLDPEGWDGEFEEYRDILRGTARAVLEAAEPLIRADARKRVLDVLRASLLTDGDGNEYEHEAGCGGEPTCPACWVGDIRAAIAQAEDPS